jgi:iron(III) transport system permease protein
MQSAGPRPRSPHQVISHAWTIASVAISLLISLPLFAILSGIFVDTRTVWHHLIQTVLGQYISNSLLLMLGVGIGVSLVGTTTAWLVTMCRFPGSNIFQWALLLPLAAPAYILAYSYTELLEYYGPIQTTLRAWFGWESARDYWFPNVRSRWGAILMLVLVLYPYVYLLARTAFLHQSRVTLEASRGLGCTPWQGFYKVALPLARPAIIAGLSLALMETLNDYGTVDFFAVPTFTIGIFRTWFAQKERLAAIQLAMLLLGFIATLVVLERWSRKHQRYYQSGSNPQTILKYELLGWRSWLAGLTCVLPIGLGFLVPAGLLLSLILPNAVDDSDGATRDFLVGAMGGDRFWRLVTNSLTLAALAAALAVIVAVILAYSKRLQPTPINQTVTQLATLGYAIPGAVIAVGTMVPLGQFDNTLDAWMRSTFGITTGLLLSGTIVALLFAYLVRFLAVAFGAVTASLENIKPNLDDASRSLGSRPGETLLKIHLPLMRGGLISATILVFVDVMKELPATLIMRPPNFDTLATRVYYLAADERLAEAAGPALTIVLVGLLPVILLSWQMGHGGKQP